MKKIIVAFSLLTLVACSAAQKSALKNLGQKSANCVLQNLDMPFEQAAQKCGVDALTDPETYQNLWTLFTSAQTGAAKLTAAKPCDKPDSGATHQ